MKQVFDRAVIRGRSCRLWRAGRRRRIARARQPDFLRRGAALFPYRMSAAARTWPGCCLLAQHSFPAARPSCRWLLAGRDVPHGFAASPGAQHPCRAGLRLQSGSQTALRELRRAVSPLLDQGNYSEPGQWRPVMPASPMRPCLICACASALSSRTTGSTASRFNPALGMTGLPALSTMASSIRFWRAHPGICSDWAGLNLSGILDQPEGPAGRLQRRRTLRRQLRPPPAR